MKTEIRTAIILGIIITISVTALSFVFSFIEDTEPATQNQENSNLQSQTVSKKNFKKVPELVGIVDYINTTPEQLQKEIQGKVVVYDIWTYSCINCIRTLPYLTAWHEKYANEGLLIIGVHSPEFEFEKDVENVKMAVKKYGIEYPVVLDNEWETWKAFENRYWPRKYVVDHEGYIRYDHIGEGAYAETERVIQQLLQERATSLGLNVAKAEPLVDIEQFQHTSFMTPELYFGYKFSSGRNYLGNSEGFSPQNDVTYTIPKDLQKNYFYLDGTWTNLQDSMRLVSKTGVIKFEYFAKEVNIVTANNGDLTILLDGKIIPTEYAGIDVDKQGKVHTDEARLYNIVSSNNAGNHILEIRINSPGFEIYTFTFG